MTKKVKYRPLWRVQDISGGGNLFGLETICPFPCKSSTIEKVAVPHEIVPYEFVPFKKIKGYKWQWVLVCVGSNDDLEELAGVLNTVKHQMFF